MKTLVTVLLASVLSTMAGSGIQPKQTGPENDRLCATFVIWTHDFSAEFLQRYFRGNGEHFAAGSLEHFPDGKKAYVPSDDDLRKYEKATAAIRKDCPNHNTRNI